SRPWIPEIYDTATHTLSQDTGHILPLDLDAQGWPTQLNRTTNDQGQLLVQLLQTAMFDGLNGHYPAGTYHAEWSGSGTLEWGGDAHVTQTGVTGDGNHYALVDVTPGNFGIQMRLETTEPADPVRDIHVWMPDYNGQSFVGQDWHP